MFVLLVHAYLTILTLSPLQILLAYVNQSRAVDAKPNKLTLETYFSQTTSDEEPSMDIRCLFERQIFKGKPSDLLPSWLFPIG